jgi:hypothetical protein
MFQFGAYPIYVIYSLNRQKAVEPLWNTYSGNEQRARKSAAEGLRTLDMGRVIRQLSVAAENEKLIYATWDWQLIEDIDSKYAHEIRAYENAIRRILTNIAATRVGTILLNTIRANPTQAKIWIIPANWTDPTAKTLQYTEAQGGGIRIQFNPTAFGRDAEPTLVHELVHAKRYAWNEFNSQPFEDREVNQEFRSSSEEFVATQVENIYIASRKLSAKYNSYYGAPRDKRAMYAFFAERPDFPIALKYFLERDQMVKQMAGLKNPEYNPFRDLEQIRKAAGIQPHLMRSMWK